MIRAASPMADAAAQPAVATNSSRFAWLCYALIGVGFLARVVLWQGTIGSNDALLWARVGGHVVTHGLAWAYANDPDCNQPPGQPILAAGAFFMARLTGTTPFTWFKAPILAAEALTCWLIVQILTPRIGRGRALGVSALYACNPVAILISGFHGNADPLPAALALWAIWLLEDRKRAFSAGLVLGAAINIKLIPILLVPALLFTSRSQRETGRFVGGLAIMALPCLVMLAWIPTVFAGKVLAYNPAIEHWGINHILIELSLKPSMNDWATQWALAYNDYGKYAVLLLATGLAIGWRALPPARRPDRYTLAAATMLIMLVFAPGFGVQYLIAPTALLLIAWPVGGISLGIVGGFYLALGYWVRWNGEFPIVAWFTRELEYVPGRTFGILTWGVLVMCLVHLLQRPFASPPAPLRRTGIA